MFARMHRQQIEQRLLTVKPPTHRKLIWKARTTRETTWKSSIVVNTRQHLQKREGLEYSNDKVIEIIGDNAICGLIEQKVD